MLKTTDYGYKTSIEMEDEALDAYAASYLKTNSKAVKSEMKQAIEKRGGVVKTPPNRMKVSKEAVFAIVVSIAFASLVAYNILTFGFVN